MVNDNINVTDNYQWYLDLNNKLKCFIAIELDTCETNIKFNNGPVRIKLVKYIIDENFQCIEHDVVDNVEYIWNLKPYDSSVEISRSVTSSDHTQYWYQLYTSVQAGTSLYHTVQQHSVLLLFKTNTERLVISTV